MFISIWQTRKTSLVDPVFRVRLSVLYDRMLYRLGDVFNSFSERKIRYYRQKDYLKACWNVYREELTLVV